jgi:hypothetical protein
MRERERNSSGRAPSLSNGIKEKIKTFCEGPSPLLFFILSL